MLRGRRHDIAQFSLISIIGLVFIRRKPVIPLGSDRHGQQTQYSSARLNYRSEIPHS
jgi:hypothetical protein